MSQGYIFGIFTWGVGKVYLYFHLGMVKDPNKEGKRSLVQQYVKYICTIWNIKDCCRLALLNNQFNLWNICPFFEVVYFSKVIFYSYLFGNRFLICFFFSLFIIDLLKELIVINKDLPCVGEHNEIIVFQDLCWVLKVYIVKAC